MRFLKPLITALSLGALATGAAQASDYEFSTSIEAQNVKISTITVTASDAIKGENVRWGSRDIEILNKGLVKKVSNRLQSHNLMNDDGARLELTLIEITPNRPTLREMSKRHGLNYASFGLGGAEVEAHLIAADGTDLGTMRYRYYASQLYDYSSGATTWYDARRSFDRFARRLAKELTASPAS